MNKLSTLIERLPYTDLVKLQKDLRAGNLDKLLAKRLDDLRPTKAKYCPVCQSDVDQNENLTLVFGPANFRQKASFDGPDCLKYFLEKIGKEEKQLSGDQQQASHEQP